MSLIQLNRLFTRLFIRKWFPRKFSTGLWRPKKIYNCVRLNFDLSVYTMLLMLRWLASTSLTSSFCLSPLQVCIVEFHFPLTNIGTNSQDRFDIGDIKKLSKYQHWAEKILLIKMWTSSKLKDRGKTSGDF